LLPDPPPFIVRARFSRYEARVTVSSMTGFARADGAESGYGWTWEIRSVNARNLDLRLRLPPGTERIEPRARAVAGERFRRGTINATLALTRAEGRAPVRVNREALDQILTLVDVLRGRVDAAPPSIDGLLGLRGVLEQAEEQDSEELRARLDERIVASFADGLDRLAAARAEEGARLATVIDGHLDEIARLAGRAQAVAVTLPAAIEKRLTEQVQALVDQQPALPAERIAQEVALLVVKADVREEIDRLAAHVESAREMVRAGGAVGRRLDFLCQEFNRESNTLCSKSSDIELTRIGLDLKTAVDQLREQVQNLE
jgi:uncharacterized protein (TIGR00255 family)